MYRTRALLWLTVSILAACAVGPNYREPLKPVGDQWAHTDLSTPKTPFRTPEWWRVFHDTNLVSLIQEGYHNNLSLQKTGVHVLQARAQLAQTVGQFYPQQQYLSGSYSYYRMGGNYLQSVLPSSFNAATLGPVVNWEIDFWGKYRRAIQSKDATFFASLAAYDNALVTLTSDIATNYMGLRETEQLMRVTKENIVIQRMSLELTQSRYRAGEVSLLDVEEAKTTLAETESELPTLMSQLQQQKDALAVLLGTTPNCIDKRIKPNTGIPLSPMSVAVGIPKEMIARRPDIYQARMSAVAQSEAIGATKAQLYPALALNGSFTFSGNTIPPSTLGEMFNWSNLNIIAGPALNWPLLNYGQLTNAVRVQDAVFQQALLDYLNTVLIAQQEVQDSITRYIEAKKTRDFLRRAARSAIKATRLTLIQYREGETDYTTVLYAEQQQLRVQSEEVKAEAEVPKALVALYRALGGGWEIKGCNDVVPERIKQEMRTRTNWGSLLLPPDHKAPKSKYQVLKQLYLPNW